MRTLKQHIILYDQECPMCSVYTKAFVITGMLEMNGRACYQHPPAACCNIDPQRAADEIALVNTITGEVRYGIHSLFAVLGNAWPFFNPLFRFGPFVWVMSKLYAFISYNRRVIIPPTLPAGNTVQPSFRLPYRLAYLVFTWLITASILNAYAPLLVPVVPAGAHYREYVVCGAQIFFQAIVIGFLAPAKRWDYLGNMMTISCAGALLLLPVTWLAKVVSLSPLLCTAWFMCVAGLMLLEHIRRTRLLGLGWALTVGWTMYRLGVLFIIFYSKNSF